MIKVHKIKLNPTEVQEQYLWKEAGILNEEKGGWIVVLASFAMTFGVIVAVAMWVKW